jgi:hypothetical protein
LASGALTVAADFPAAQAGLIRPGARVVISSEILGKSAVARIQLAGQPEAGGDGGGQDGAAQGDAAGGQDGGGGQGAAGGQDPAGASPGTADPGGGAAAGGGGPGGDGPGYVVASVRPLGAQWAGQDVKVRVVSAATKGKVLAVPVTAIVAGATGDTEVVVVDKKATGIANANPRRVKVTVGATGGGWVEITPAKGAQIAEGDPVQLSAPLDK